MLRQMPKLMLFIDHDNTIETDSAIRTLIEKWLLAIDDKLPSGATLSMHIRAYGGWFSGDSVTDARFIAAKYYQTNCPAIFSYNGRIYRILFEFADHLLASEGRETPLCSIRITHTVVYRSAAQYIKIREGSEPCTEEGCQLKDIRRWIIRKRACPRSSCPRLFSEYFEHKQQKQVDVHLALDAVSCAIAANPGDHLAIASDDWDLLPAIAAASLKLSPESSISILRRKKKGTYLDNSLRALSVKLLDIEEEDREN